MMLGYTVLLAVLTLGAGAGQQDYNNVIDDFIAKSNDVLKRNGHNIYKLDDIETTFAFGPKGLERGRFAAHDGLVTGLATIKRVGDVKYTPASNSFILDLDWSYDKLSFSYKQFQLHYSADLSGGIEMRFPELSGTMQITVNWTKNSGCEAELTGAKIHSLGKPLYIFTADQIPQDFRYNVLKWVMQTFQTPGDKIVEGQMLDALRQNLNLADFCNLTQ
uniref:Uncharacterized protein n=1 Tax=Riptortus pedestris TaxID=329032 RepID=R4WD16_RIPPE|nr:unknown secreted protein [Riptortus pedestris]